MAHIVTEDPSDEETSEQPAIEITRRQSLAPLLVLGVATAAMGFYVVFATRGANESSEEREPLGALELQVNPPEGKGLDVSIDAIELTYKFPHPQRHRYKLSQRSERSVKGDITRAQTRIDFTLASRPEEQTEEAEGATWRHLEVEFGGVRAQVGSGADDAFIGQSVLGQLESMLEGKKARVKKSDVGRTRDFAWLGDSNPQTLRARQILRDNLALLSPRFPRQVLKIGESWTYEVPFGGVADTETSAPEVTGKVTVRNELVGATTLDGVPVVVIVQQLRVSGQGKTTPSAEKSDEKEGAPITFTVSGTGKGLAHFNQEIGILHRYDVMLDQKLEIEQTGKDPVEQNVRYELQTKLER